MAVNKPNVKTYWQPFSTDADTENLQAVLPHLVCVHIFEWNAQGRRYSLKHGKDKWRAFLKIIENSNTEPYLIMEFVKHDSRHQFAKDVKALIDIIEGVSDERI